MPLHLAHLQFYGYGTREAKILVRRGARWRELVNATPEVTIDIGQVMFGQTVTISSDVMRQFSGAGLRASEEIRQSMTATAIGGGIVPTATVPTF